MQFRILLIVSVFALGGCASSQANPQSTTTEPEAAQVESSPVHGMHGGMNNDMAGMCPMAVEGTTARAEDVEGAASIVFTTTGDVIELRRRVARMAEMHNRHHGEGHGDMMGMRAGGMHEGMMGEGMTPPSTTQSEQVETGARLVFTPRDPADLTKLREHVRERAEQMASGKCPMMSMHAQGAATGPSKAGDHEGHHPGGNN